MPKLHADGTVTDITQVVPDPNVDMATEDVVPEREPALDEPAGEPAPERPASRRRPRGAGTKDS